MSTVGVFEKVISDLRGDGYRVREVKGWRTRGAETLTIYGQVWHHTAGSRNGNTPSLALCINGASRGLPNALCNWYVARDGTLYVVAARTAWHAGSGGAQGLSRNSQVFGIECENTGLGEKWKSYGSQVALAAAVKRHAGHSEARILDHKEWTRRKIDRTGISPSQFRQDVRNFKGRTTGHQPGDSEVYQLGDKGAGFAIVQEELNFVLEAFDAQKDVPGGVNLNLSYKLKVDGAYGPKSRRLVRHLKRQVLGGSFAKASGKQISAVEVAALARRAESLRGRAHSLKGDE